MFQLLAYIRGNYGIGAYYLWVTFGCFYRLAYFRPKNAIFDTILIGKISIFFLTHTAESIQFFYLIDGVRQQMEIK